MTPKDKLTRVRIIHATITTVLIGLIVIAFGVALLSFLGYT